MMEDISRSTVAILLVVTVFLSVVGTWTVIEVVGDAGGQPAMIQPSQSGQVRLDYAGEPAKVPQTDDSSGVISLGYAK